jgi:hypothetical protein
VGSEIIYQRRRRTFQAVGMVYEGGGIRRGFTPVEVGILLDLTEDKLLILGLIELLQKEFLVTTVGNEITVEIAELLAVSGEILNPKDRRQARKAISRDQAQILTDAEDVLLELIRQHQGKPISTLAPGVWVEELSTSLEWAMGGFDLQQTREYYDAYITHRLNGVVAGHFQAEEYVGWMAIARFNSIIPPESLNTMIQKTRPAWLPGESFDKWLNLLVEAVVD